MKNKVIKFAQKAIVLKKEGGKIYILLIKYEEAPHKNTCTVEGKYGCPGGRLEFGEDLDKALIRECEEETGITIIPKEPVGLISWHVEKPDEFTHMVAVFRICKAVSGELKGKIDERETKIEGAKWVDITKFDFKEKLIKDEVPMIQKVLSHLK